MKSPRLSSQLLLPALVLCMAKLAQAEPATTHAMTLPIADVHFHQMPFMTAEDLKARLDKHNIRWVVSAGAAGPAAFMKKDSSFARDLEYKKVLGDRFLPAVGWLELQEAESDAGTQLYAGEPNARREVALQLIDERLGAGRHVISETFPNAETSTTIRLLARRVATDSPVFVELYKLSIKYKVPLPMHMQWHHQSVEQLGKLLASDARGVVLLSHCGKDTNAADIRLLFEKHANVLCDLGFRSPPQGAAEGGRDPARTIFWGDSFFSKPGIKPEWKQLIEDYPDRFMVAIDDVHRWSTYDEVVAAIRSGVLAQLTPGTAEKVAYKNAIRVFGLSDAADLPIQAETKKPDAEKAP